MTDIAVYYAVFEQGLRAKDHKLADEFTQIESKGLPREAFLWLEDLRLSGKLPKQLEKQLTGFYWLFC